MKLEQLKPNELRELADLLEADPGISAAKIKAARQAAKDKRAKQARQEFLQWFKPDFDDAETVWAWWKDTYNSPRKCLHRAAVFPSKYGSIFYDEYVGYDESWKSGGEKLEAELKEMIEGCEATHWLNTLVATLQHGKPWEGFVRGKGYVIEPPETEYELQIDGGCPSTPIPDIAYRVATSSASETAYGYLTPHGVERVAKLTSAPKADPFRVVDLRPKAVAVAASNVQLPSAGEVRTFQMMNAVSVIQLHHENIREKQHIATH